MPNVVNDMLNAYYTTDRAIQSREAGNLNRLQGLLQMRGVLTKQQQEEQVKSVLSNSRNLEEAIPALMKVGPLGIQAAQHLSTIQSTQAQAPLRAAQTAEALRKSEALRGQTEAQGRLAGLLSTGGYQGPVEGPSSVATTEQDALRQVMEAETQGRPLGVNVPNPANVRALAVQADPAHAIPELLRQGRPDKTFSSVHNVPGGYLERQPDGTVRFVRTQDTTERPMSDIAKLNNDLKAGRITQEQFDAASRTRLGNTSVIPEEHSTLHGDDYLKTLPQGMQNSVKAVVEGRVPLTSFSIRNNQRDAMIQRAQQYDPTFEAGKAPARMAVQRDFTSGVAARNVTMINTAIRHLGTLDRIADTLDNKDTRVVNALTNEIANQFGDPRINNLRMASSAVGTELMRVFRQVNASEAEIKDWSQKFTDASSPAQFRGAVQTAVELLDGRIKALDEQWMRGMDTDKGYPNLLTPISKTILEKVSKPPQRRSTDSQSGWSIRAVP